MDMNINNNPQPSYIMDYSKVKNASSTGQLPYEPVKKVSKLKNYVKRPVKYVMKRPGMVVALAMMGMTCFMRFGANAGTSHPKVDQQSTVWAYNQGAQHVRDSLKIVQAQEQHIQDSIKIANLEKQLLELTSKAGKRLPK